ncbi:MAG: DUF2255 family protein [Thermomicrobium sp.]|nr:DUF2255 family protein [Thermomicrobium sp.]MDW8060739.1 DUF2255 family protein [Thermomicrobium sp.]
MSAWSESELRAIGEAREIKLAPLRRDGTLRRPVTVWVVRVGDRLFVRSWLGEQGAWYRAARASGRGRLWVDSLVRDIRLRAETDPMVNEAIDAAYRTKYRRHPAQYVEAMVSPRARATTLELLPE